MIHFLEVMHFCRVGVIIIFTIFLGVIIFMRAQGMVCPIISTWLDSHGMASFSASLV